MSLDPGKDMVRYLSDLKDVSNIAPTDNFVLTWDSATGLWTPEAAGGGGEANTSSNAVIDSGTQKGLAKAKVGVDLPFKVIQIGSAKLSIATDVSNVTLDVVTGTTATTVCIGNDARLSDARTPLAHTHVKADITDFTHTHVAADVTDFNTQVRTSRLDQMATPTVDTSFGNIKITSLADPTADQDGANKRYVDNLSQGVRWKESVRAATTAAQVLATDFENLDIIDGVTLATGDRVLIKNQAAGAENGIYTVNAAGSPTRALDFDENDEVSQSAVFVKEGTANAESGFVLTNDGAIVIGTTALTFTQFTGLGQVTAGAALTKTGNTLDVNVDGTTIEVSGDALRVKDLGITYAKIQNVSATDRILGRDTAGAGVIEELTAAQVKTMIAITKADVTDFAHNVLDSTYHGDVLTGSIAQGDLLKGNATPKIAKFAKGTLDQRIRVNSTATDIEYFDEIATLTYIISGGGSAISTGAKGFLEIPFACTIVGWTLLADVSGSIVIDVWNDTYANFPPVVADTIAGTEKPTLSAVQKNQDLALTTWITAVAAGDILRFNVDSAATVTEVTLSIRVRKRD